MKNLDIKNQYLGLPSSFNLNDESPYGNHGQSEESRIKTTTNVAEKQSYQLGVLIFIIATITVYGFGIHQLTNTVIDIVETVVEETNKDYH